MKNPRFAFITLPIDFLLYTSDIPRNLRNKANLTYLLRKVESLKMMKRAARQARNP
jgi:hypothetical protein